MSAVGDVNRMKFGYAGHVDESQRGFQRESSGSRKVSENPPPIAADVAQVPSVAVLIDPLSESFSGLMMRDDELLKIDRSLRSSKHLNAREISKIYEFLFENGNFIRFIEFRGKDDDSQNAQFELFLTVIDADRINELPQKERGRFYDFAFSNTRFNWIQLRSDEISGRLAGRLLSFENEYRRDTIFEDVSRFRSLDGGRRAEVWLVQRMNGSSTIALPTSKQKLAERNWRAAEDKVVQRARQGGRVSFGMVQIVHKALTQGEEGVSSPGELRGGVVRSSRAVEVYPPPGELYDRTVSYARWLDEEVGQCEKGQKSAILTASQAYQRLVSLHPFENGNGRISRFMMDYVLYRSGLPPAILGKEVLDAVFVLNPKSADKNEQFVQKIFNGVVASYGHIYPNRPVSK